MECPRCHSSTVPAAHYCSRCGVDLRSGDARRTTSFAVRPDEPVASFAVVSTIMPRGSGQQPQTYRIALTLALVVALLAAIFGAVPIAVLVAAFAVPLVYIVYLYDVNLWEDQPVLVTVAGFGVTGALAALFTWLWSRLLPLSNGGLDTSGPAVRDLLVLGLLVPVVGMLITQVGPTFLASRPAFDDLMDGLTFGVVAGVAYAAFETVVLQWDLLTSGPQGLGDPALWMSIVFSAGFVKPLLYGTAAGLAGAEFSGLGKGYDGFTGRYLRAVVLSMVVWALYQAGVYLLGFVGHQPLGQILGVAWGLVLLSVLILRLRTVLHVGLMEAALESEARLGGVGSGELEHCPQCEMPLLPQASFCSACGTSLRAKGRAVHPDGIDAGHQHAHEGPEVTR